MTEIIHIMRAVIAVVAVPAEIIKDNLWLATTNDCSSAYNRMIIKAAIIQFNSFIQPKITIHKFVSEDFTI